MDVLQPDIIYVNGRRYRRNPIDVTIVRPTEAYLEDDVELEEQNDDDDFAVEQTEKGFRVSMNVAAEFFKFIIGKSGETKKKIERETKCRISVPTKGSDGQVVLSGSDKVALLAAQSRIEVLVESAKMKQPWTHFLSIPLNTPHMQQQFQLFKDEVLKRFPKARSVDSSIFQNPAKLHLTIGTLKLYGAEDKEKAIELLQNSLEAIIRKNVEEKPPAKIHVQGLEYMNDDPGEVDVLYAKVSLNGLQRIADELVGVFSAAGLAHHDSDGSVKLHATLMNSKLRRNDDDTIATEIGNRRHRASRHSFDAEQILTEFKDYFFSDVPFETIHLSERFSSGSDNYYNCAHSITF